MRCQLLLDRLSAHAAGFNHDPFVEYHNPGTIPAATIRSRNGPKPLGQYSG